MNDFYREFKWFPIERLNSYLGLGWYDPNEIFEWCNGELFIYWRHRTELLSEFFDDLVRVTMEIMTPENHFKKYGRIMFSTTTSRAFWRRYQPKIEEEVLPFLRTHHQDQFFR